MLVERVELVFESTSPDALSTLSRTGGVSALYHESLYIAMEQGAVVVSASCQGQEVFRCSRNSVAKYPILRIDA